MQLFIEQVVAGLAAGGIYASLALALVIIYTAMGLVNFAQGEFAMFATFICYTLITSLNVPYFLALPLAIGFAFIFAFGIERVVVRPFYKSSQLSIVIVTWLGRHEPPKPRPALRNWCPIRWS